MASEPTVLRRYTPPTCTLEIAAQQSPLSRWMGKMALKDLRFKLSLDDPRLANQDWVVLRGDQQQLESLVGVVGDYVQNFLSQSQGAVGTAIISPPTAPRTAIANTSGIALEPFGLLSHQLQLGSLATVESGDSITLSSTQLADLASALDDYNAEATALPNFTRPSLKDFNWGAIAAGGLLTVGLSTALLKGLDSSSRNPAPQEASSGDQRVALQPSMPPSPTPSPGLTPLPLGSMTPPPPTGITITPNNATTSTGSTATGSTATGSTAATQPSNAPPIVSVPEKSDGTPEIKPIPNPGKPDTPPATEQKSSSTQKSNQQSAEGAIDRSLPQLSPGVPVEPITGSAARTANRSEAPIAPAAPAPVLPSNSQSQEVEQFFKRNWKPAAPITENAEYLIQVAADGTRQALTPLNKAAEDNLVYTGLPLDGEAFVSPNPNNRPSTVRVVIDKNGSIQAFLQE